MTFAEKKEMGKRKKGDYYKLCVRNFGRKEANRIIFKQVMGYYPEEEWMYKEKK